MSDQFPDLRADIKLIFADGDLALSLLKYRGTHAKFKREAVWQEAWTARLSEGQIIESWPIIDQSSLLRHLGFQLVSPKKQQLNPHSGFFAADS